jgi:hypothetical protein
MDADTEYVSTPAPGKAKSPILSSYVPDTAASSEFSFTVPVTL